MTCETCEKIRADLDAARAEVERLKRPLDSPWVPLSIRGNDAAERLYRDTQRAWESVVAERDAALARVEKAERERDEALAEILRGDEVSVELVAAERRIAGAAEARAEALAGALLGLCERLDRWWFETDPDAGEVGGVQKGDPHPWTAAARAALSAAAKEDETP